MSEQKPLEGVKVLDLSRLLPGPYASMILADLGAQVDKVEDPGGGDWLRITPPTADDGMGTLYHWVNRGKRSIILDLKKPEGRDAFMKLLPHYDVVLEGNRPGVMERLGLGYETLKKAHPGLVYCAITGYGQTGPDSQKAGHDINYVARAGIFSFTGPADAAPALPGTQMADISGGLYAVIGILSALKGRDKSGEGSFVDISMNECALSLGLFGLACRIGGFDPPRGGDMLMGGIAQYRNYTTKDGGSVSLGALEPKFWNNFCAAVDIEPDPMAGMPGPHQPALIAKIEEIFASRTRDEWKKVAAEVDCCMEVVMTTEEVIADPHLVERGVWMDRPTGGGGTVKAARTPAAPQAEGMAPKQGEQTDEILRQGGFSDDEISALKGSGVTR